MDNKNHRIFFTTVMDVTGRWISKTTSYFLLKLWMRLVSVQTKSISFLSTYNKPQNTSRTRLIKFNFI
ncbi:uncharacterized protein METZ01_LOCUS58114 [marine metagenome]|uniref:Uncharacterized protein n=1 Tax=marine metagenome TaxID=408172 RepID=A0A381SMJ7_9ZZZZ